MQCGTKQQIFWHFHLPLVLALQRSCASDYESLVTRVEHWCVGWPLIKCRKSVKVVGTTFCCVCNSLAEGGHVVSEDLACAQLRCFFLVLLLLFQEHTCLWTCNLESSSYSFTGINMWWIDLFTFWVWLPKWNIATKVRYQRLLEIGCLVIWVVPFQCIISSMLEVFLMKHCHTLHTASMHNVSCYIIGYELECGMMCSSLHFPVVLIGGSTICFSYSSSGWMMFLIRSSQVRSTKRFTISCSSGYEIHTINFAMHDSHLSPEHGPWFVALWWL